jgi:hypothetical protein
MKRFATTLLAVLSALSAANAFSSTATFLGSSVRTRMQNNNQLSMKVIDIDSEKAFDKTVKGAGAALVVVDYSTTWCGTLAYWRFVGGMVISRQLLVSSGQAN